MPLLHTVVVIIEAKQEGIEPLKTALAKVAFLSQQEEGNVSYRAIQDEQNPCRFALYEEWTSSEVHQQQFTKPYIQEFATIAEPLLAKPYELVIGHPLKSDEGS